MAYSRLVIDVTDKIGSGAFSVIFKGKLSGDAPKIQSGAHFPVGSRTNMEVAVKMLPEQFAGSDASNDALLAEIALMAKMGQHPHLLCLLACVTLTQPLCLVTEFCSNGSVLSLIRKHRQSLSMVMKREDFAEMIVQYERDQSTRLIFKDLLSFAWQVSNGMVRSD